MRRFVIKDKETGLYFRNVKAWFPAADRARLFGNEEEAQTFLTTLKPQHLTICEIALAS
jgi:hypothetical protein